MRSYIYFIYLFKFKIILKEYLFLTYSPIKIAILFYCNSSAVIYFEQLIIYCIAPTFIYLFYCNNIYSFIVTTFIYLFFFLKIINFFLHHLMEFFSGFAFRSNRDVSFGLNKNLVCAISINIIYCWRWSILRPFIRTILDIHPGRYYLRIILGTGYFH